MSNTDEFAFNFEDVDNVIDFSDAETVVVKEAEQTVEPVAPEAEAEKTEEDEELHTEYLVIYDSIMFEDKFEKEYKLGKKYSAKFSTRSADADIKISRQLDRMEFSTMHALQTMSAVLTMSHSLVGLNGKDLRDMTPADRYEFIRSKSSHLIEVLSRHMVGFDALVRGALSYGEENF